MAGAGGPAGANGHKLAGVLKSLGAIEVRLGGGGQGGEQKQRQQNTADEKGCGPGRCFPTLSASFCGKDGAPSMCGAFGPRIFTVATSHRRRKDHFAAFLASLALRREGCTHQATPMPTR